MNIFEVLREQLEISKIAASFTRLKRVGARMLGCCPLPNHKESIPSFNLYPDGRAHCYGCGFHGDIVDLWAAVNGLKSGIQAAFDLAHTYNIRIPVRDLEAEIQEQRRRQREAKYAHLAKTLHEELLHQPHIISYWRSRGFDDELQKRFLLGANREGTAAIIPFWNQGRIYGLVRRHLEKEPKYLLPKAKHFPDGYKPLFAPTSLYGDLYIVEGFVDALSLAALGFNAVAIAGNKISQQQSKELQRLTGPFYILPDNDERGAAADEWLRLLYPSAKICSAEYGEGLKDAADLFAAQREKSTEVILELRAQALDALDFAFSKAPKDSKRAIFRFAKEQVLPLIIRIKDEGERHAAIEDAAKALSLRASDLRKTLSTELIQSSEETKKSNLPEPGTERHKQAMTLLNTPDILQQAVNDMESLGHVGESSAKQLAFICALSARMGSPIQPSTHAQSSAGKNTLWDTVLSLFPPEMVIRRSGLSAKALFRTQVNLERAILYLQEVAGAESADYSIRILQSDGKLEYEATEKMSDNSFRNVIHRVEGPTVIVQTTTKNHLHPENETRVLPIYIDESEEQTERIIRNILKDAAGKGPDYILIETKQKTWHDAIRLLQPGIVVIPYAERIIIPNSPIRIRRDIHKLLDVVGVITWLHQYQRERDPLNRILATEEDFEVALKLLKESLERAWKILTPAEEKVLSAIEELRVERHNDEGFRRRDLQVPDVSDRRIKEVLRSLTETGYLDCDSKPGPQGYVYTVARRLQTTNLGIRLDPVPEKQELSESKADISGDAYSARPCPLDAGNNGSAPVKQALSGEIVIAR
jgi:DNA primase/nitrogen regulatory protein PII-like uncharacterized protein